MSKMNNISLLAIIKKDNSVKPNSIYAETPNVQADKSPSITTDLILLINNKKDNYLYKITMVCQ